MWKPLARSLDLLVAWIIRRRLISRSTHRTDPAALGRLLNDIGGLSASALFPPPEPVNPDEVVFQRDSAIANGEHWVVRMPSPYPTDILQNKVIWLRALLPPGRGWRCPIVVAVHPWIGPGGRSHLRRHGRQLLSRGVGLVAVTLPHHFQRTAPGSWSGELSVCGDLVAVSDAARQGVADLQRVLAWLRSQGSPRVAMVGFSLGAGMAAMMAALDAELACVAAMAPVAVASSCLRESALTGGTIRCDLSDSGLSDGLFEGICAVLSPVSHNPALPASRLLVVGPRHDAILPPSAYRALADHWGCDLWETPHGHISLFLARRWARRVIAWTLERLGI